jgi:uncharacterized protein
MIDRNVSCKINELSKKYPIIAVVGPRQSGKSTLIKSMFRDYQYVNLESPTIREFAENDPEGFLQKYSSRVIFDEIQNVPKLFSYLQVIVDENKIMGDFIISGSSQFKLREQISQSLAGRVAIFNLLPLSYSELSDVNMASSQFSEMASQGFYPAIYDRKIDPIDYYADYVQTYVERDVRSIINVKDLKIFQTFLKLCAGRVGSVINYTSLGNDVGVSRETIKTWISVLETSFIAYQLQPYYENLGKRLLKSPKLYFYDTGLLCYLLNINAAALDVHPLKGGIFENLIINELMKSKFNHHQNPEFYFYEEFSGAEIDLITKLNGKFVAVEMKSAQTIHASFFKNLKKWGKLIPAEQASCYVVYGGDQEQVRDGIKIVPWFKLNKIVIEC